MNIHILYIRSAFITIYTLIYLIICRDFGTRFTRKLLHSQILKSGCSDATICGATSKRLYSVLQFVGLLQLVALTLVTVSLSSRMSKNTGLDIFARALSRTAYTQQRRTRVENTSIQVPTPIASFAKTCVYLTHSSACVFQSIIFL